MLSLVQPEYTPGADYSHNVMALDVLQPRNLDVLLVINASAVQGLAPNTTKLSYTNQPLDRLDIARLIAISLGQPQRGSVTVKLSTFQT